MAEYGEKYNPFPGGVGIGKKCQEIQDFIAAAADLGTLDKYWTAVENYPNLTTFERYLLKGLINKRREALATDQEKQNGTPKTGPGA